MLLIAPPNAEWVAPARASFIERGRPIACLESVSLVGFFMGAGGVGALIVDAQALDPGAAARIAALQRTHPEIVVVVIGSSSGPDVKRALEGGGTVYLSWPFGPEELADVLSDPGPPPA